MKNDMTGVVVGAEQYAMIFPLTGALLSIVVLILHSCDLELGISLSPNLIAIMRRQPFKGGTRDDGNAIGVVQGDAGFQDVFSTQPDDQTACTEKEPSA